MTGSRRVHCVFCRIFRIFELNGAVRKLHVIRLPPLAGCTVKTRRISTAVLLSEKKKNFDIPSDTQADETSSSDSSSSDSSSSDSSGSDTETEEQVVKETLKSEPKSVNTGDLLALLRAGEKKWGGKKEAESNLKEMLHSVDKKLVGEARKLSEVLPGDKTKNESELLGQLLSQFDKTTKQKKGEQPRKDEGKKKSLTEIMEGITIEKAKTVAARKGVSFDHYGDATEEKKKIMAFREPGVGLFSGKPLGIFTKEDMKNAQQEKRSLFEVVEEEQRQQLHFYPPRNAFEEQIQWTMEGKLWTFPIDNEAGWEEEKKVEFHEHVFLENQLSDFPKKGPIRHFMELVTVALSKNPYLTVEQKHEHIDWYRNYFREKETILKERLGKDGVISSKQEEKLQ